ncbi:LysR family transcriptional regulator [Nocardioides sp. ChNu-153]|uniref:LysR family transcriptional regulator n=1 Tax=unclassified Nocardioides TaxID=2615069 RepID=UPI002406EA26|nr:MULTISPECIES: LysR family transcriptional regulator [unclassified Nocardioides]MDF9715675.1 LysR family transcriptional regulator [Nocardioides sp. ChNu-99]MDN7121658.1 LysR family transcriptional regulator [Nocardioides sp. ChNu-153]
MDPRRVLLFRTVARAGSLSAAARELGTTQSAVSQQLRALEREAGGALLVRTARGTTPTEAGAALLARADAVHAALHQAQEELGALADLRAGTVRLAAFPSAAATLVPAVVRALQGDHPGLRVTLVESEPPEAWAAVLAGDADVALVFGYDGPPADDGALAWVPLGVEPLHLVLPPGAAAPGAPGGEGSAVPGAWLAEQDWVAGCERCRGHLLERCRAAGFEPRLVHESDDYVVVQNLVAHGLGVTVLPQLALTAFRHPEVEARRAPAFGERHVGLVHRPGAEDVPAVRAVMERLVGRAGTVLGVR